MIDLENEFIGKHPGRGGQPECEKELNTKIGVVSQESEVGNERIVYRPKF